VLAAHGRTPDRGPRTCREKGASLTLTILVDPREHRHGEFLQREDIAQRIYEKARKAHGVAGLFIDPEAVLPAAGNPGDRRNTALHRTHLSDETFERIAKSLAECVGVTSTARIQDVNKKTVLSVLTRAAEQATRVSEAMLHDVSVSECQLDEMWSFVQKKEKNLNSIEKLRSELGDAWIWIAFDAVNKVVLASVVGKRTAPHAVALVEEVKRVTAHMPKLFSSDQLPQYTEALLRVYGEPVQSQKPRGRRRPGRPSRPKLVPPDDLLYVQVVKRFERGSVAKVERRVVFGDSDQVHDILKSSQVSRKINTSYVERQNCTVRHLDARCTRKTLRFSKCMRNHKRQLDLSLAYYHLCRPHRTLSKRQRRPTTPFMAASLTDCVWTMRELLETNPEDLRR